MWATILLALLFPGATTGHGEDVVRFDVSPGVDLAVDIRTGSYWVTRAGATWLAGIAPTTAAAAKGPHSPGGLLLTPGSASRTTGTDAQGGYESLELGWSTADHTVNMVTQFAVYTAADSPAIRFTQRYPTAIANASGMVPGAIAPTGMAFVAFPAFRLSGTTVVLNALSFSGCQIQYAGASRWSKFHGAVSHPVVFCPPPSRGKSPVARRLPAPLSERHH